MADRYQGCGKCDVSVPLQGRFEVFAKRVSPGVFRQGIYIFSATDRRMSCYFVSLYKDIHTAPDKDNHRHLADVRA